MASSKLGCSSHRMIGCAVLAGSILGMSLAASGQDQSGAIAKDAIFARKILMDTIGTNMDELEGMTASAKGVDLAEPHLFAASTNQWKPNVERDPGRDTYASPDLWTNYPDFYAQAANASKIAYKASRAEREKEFKTFVAELRVACDSCHAVYLKSEQ